MQLTICSLASSTVSNTSLRTLAPRKTEKWGVKSLRCEIIGRILGEALPELDGYRRIYQLGPRTCIFKKGSGNNVPITTCPEKQV